MPRTAEAPGTPSSAIYTVNEFYPCLNFSINWVKQYAFCYIRLHPNCRTQLQVARCVNTPRFVCPFLANGRLVVSNFSLLQTVVVLSLVKAPVLAFHGPRSGLVYTCKARLEDPQADLPCTWYQDRALHLCAAARICHQESDAPIAATTHDGVPGSLPRPPPLTPL